MPIIMLWIRAMVDSIYSTANPFTKPFSMPWQKPINDWALWNVTLPALMFLFLLLEIAARTLLPTSDIPDVIFDLHIGNHYRANQTGLYTSGMSSEIKARYRINNKGWNSPNDYKNILSGNNYSIAVIGDSFYGWQFWIKSAAGVGKFSNKKNATPFGDHPVSGGQYEISRSILFFEVVAGKHKTVWSQRRHNHVWRIRS